MVTRQRSASASRSVAGTVLVVTAEDDPEEADEREEVEEPAEADEADEPDEAKEPDDADDELPVTGAGLVLAAVLAVYALGSGMFLLCRRSANTD